jgi:2-iminobutanoate/2-iminopropanoate deaminase
MTSAPPLGPYSPVISAGPWRIVSGQIGQVDGTLVEGGVTEQLTQAIANLADLLQSVGATLAHVVKTTVFVTDMADFAAMNEAYVEAFGRHRPARSTVAVAGLPGGAIVEIEAWAYVGGGSEG